MGSVGRVSRNDVFVGGWSREQIRCNSMSACVQVICEPPEKGEYKYGHEFEGVLEPGEKHWNVVADEKLLAADALVVAGDWESSGALVASEVHDKAIELEEAELVAQRLKRLRGLRAESIAAGVPHASHTIDETIRLLERGKAGTGRKEIGNKPMNAILARHMRVEAGKKYSLRMAKQAKYKAQADRKARLAKVSSLLKKQKAISKMLKKKNEAEIAKLPSAFSSLECGQGKKWKGQAALRQRVRCLDRLKLRAPPLPLALEVQWVRRRDAWAKAIAVEKREDVGNRFINSINYVLEQLGQWYDGPTPYNKPGSEPKGRQDAFERFVVKLEKYVPKSMKVAMMG